MMLHPLSGGIVKFVAAVEQARRVDPGDMLIPVVHEGDDIRLRSSASRSPPQGAAHHLRHQNGGNSGTGQEHGLCLRQVHSLREDVHIDENLQTPLPVCLQLSFILGSTDGDACDAVFHIGHNEIGLDFGLIEQGRKLDGVNDVDGKHDGLTVLFLLCQVCIHDQLVAGRAHSNLFRDVIRQNIQMLNALPGIQAKTAAVFLIGVVRLKNRLGENLPVDQFLQPNLIGDVIWIDFCQQALLILRCPKRRRSQTDQFHTWDLASNIVNDFAVGFSRGVVSLVYNQV